MPQLIGERHRNLSAAASCELLNCSGNDSQGKPLASANTQYFNEILSALKTLVDGGMVGSSALIFIQVRSMREEE